MNKSNGKKKLADFRPQRVNANKHKPHGLAALDNSIRKDGWIGAVTVAADGESFDGSARIETLADAMPSSEPIVVETDGTRPVVVVRTDIPNTDDPRAKRLGVAANVIGVMDYNPDGEILAMLAAQDDAIARLVKQEDASAAAILAAVNGSGNGDAEPQIDRAEELNKKWKVKTGNLWRIGEHRLLCGDSTKREDVNRVMGGEKAGATVTDPPYGVGVEYGTFVDTPENAKELIKNFMPFVLENLPAAVVSGVASMWEYPRPAWVGAWVHPAAMAPGPWGFNGNNPILYYGKCPYLKIGKGSHPDSVVMAADREGVDGHPTPKPLKMWQWLVERMTPEAGMTVFDPFGGSGTTVVACNNLGRKCRTIEIDPKYCAVILERMVTAFPGIEIERIG